MKAFVGTGISRIIPSLGFFVFFLVVTSITPLAASATYIAADASFKTEMLAISFGSINFKLPGIYYL